MTVELKSRLWFDHRSEKWTNNRPIKIEAIPLTTVSTSSGSTEMSLLSIYYVNTSYPMDSCYILVARPVLPTNRKSCLVIYNGRVMCIG